MRRLYRDLSISGGASKASGAYRGQGRNHYSNRIRTRVAFDSLITPLANSGGSLKTHKRTEGKAEAHQDTVCGHKNNRLGYRSTAGESSTCAGWGSPKMKSDGLSHCMLSLSCDGAALIIRSSSKCECCASRGCFGPVQHFG